MIILYIIFIITMFFAWAIGGEEHFGKGKRGLLLAIPLTIFGLFHHIPIWLLIIQPGYLWCLYQLLKYDPGISFIYTENKPLIGWGIIALNGLAIGLTPVLLTNGVLSVILTAIAGAAGFCLIVYLANDMKIEVWRLYVRENFPSWPYLRFNDTWYLCCGLMGAILGVLTWLN
jgi:hypothetical protein